MATYSITTRSTGEILTAAKYNADHQNHADNNIPTSFEDYSSSTAQMQSTADPYPGAVESLPTTLAGELERLRYLLKQITGKAQWYIDPDTNLATLATSALVPTGCVAFFALASCPTGWSEYTTLRGRYAVGLVASGTLEATVGTALTNTENRAVGQHNHSVTDPGHTHFTPNGFHVNAAGVTNGGGSGGSTVAATDSNTTGVTVNNTGSVAGTNAPYVQLLACKRN